MDKNVERDLARKGLTKEMVQAAADVAGSLERAEESEMLVRDSLMSFQQLARRLDKEVEVLTERAKVLLTTGDEGGAKGALLKREAAKGRLVSALKSAAGEKERLKKMEDNVGVIRMRAVVVENTMKTIAAETMTMNAGGGGGFELRTGDPLLEKFKALEDRLDDDDGGGK